MTVAAVLRAKGSAAVVSVPPEASVAEVAALISRRRIGAVVVVDGEGRLVGILSERDVVRGLTEHGAALLEMPAERLMTREVQLAAPETSVTEAMEAMDSGHFRHLPVVGRDGALCGIVSIRDLVRHRLEMQQGDVETLQAYVMGGGYGTGALT